MIFRVNPKTTLYIGWKPIRVSGEVTYRVFEAGYELCSKFETIWFLSIGKLSFMLDVFDHQAASAAGVERAVSVLPPPPVVETESGCKIVRFAAHRRAS